MRRRARAVVDRDPQYQLDKTIATVGLKLRSPTETRSEITFSPPSKNTGGPIKISECPKISPHAKKRVVDTHRGAGNRYDAIQATHASTTPESMADTTGDSPNVQPLPPGAPGSRVILVRMIGCVLHVLNFSIMS